jgi:hypothetical protein
VILAGLAVTLQLAACDTAGRHLYIAHNTVVGVDAAVNMDQPRGHLLIGYDRQFVGYIPRSVPVESNGVPDPKKRDAMTAIACSRVEVTGLYLTQFTEYLATGPAARKYAESLQNGPGSELRECLEKPAAPPR